MTKVLLVCGEDGAFKRVSAEGHAGFAGRGKDIVCAAETMLLRTALDVLQKTSGVFVSADASVRGRLCYEASGSATERLVCVADFIREGIKALSEEFPGNISFQEELEK